MELSRPTPEIMLFRNIFSRSTDTIEYVEREKWVTAQILDDNDSTVTEEARDTDISTQLQYNSSLYSAVFSAFDVAQREYCKHFPLRIRTGTDFNVLRYGTGQHYKEHVDQGWGCLDRVLSGLLYLNDDFEGGEIYFSNQELTLTPETGMLVLFPSNFLFPHLVKPVTAGWRYSVVCWMS